MAKHEYGANITCIALDDGLVFVESGMSTELAAAFRSAMEARFERKTQALLLTHGHIDHFLGMAAFSDVDVVAAAVGKPLFERQLAIEFDEEKIEMYTGIFPKFRESIATAKPFLPTVWFDEETSLGKGDKRLVFRNTGGHTSCSSYVYFEPEGLIVAGDLLQVDQYVYFGDPTTDLDAWIATLKLWAGMEVRNIAPGHGRAVDRGYLPQVWGFFESLIATVKELKVEGVSIEETVRHSRLPKGYWDEKLPEPRWYPYCIAALYRSL
jgi:glyoxylase-like metal-dependent hydrolase (beta-lactamase superfamily II)